MTFKFEEINKANEILILANKLDRLLKQIAKEFANNFGKQTVNHEIINKINNLNNKYERESKISKTESEKIIYINSKNIDNNLIEQYWYLIENKNISIVYFKKMFEKVDKLITLNKNSNNLSLLFKKIESIENKKYSSTFLDLFIILDNYNQFMKTNNFDKNWYLRIIFKELFSLIDKIIFENCLHYSLEKNGFDFKTIKNNPTLKYLILNFLPIKTNKWNLYLFEKYNLETKQITLKRKKNFILKNIEYDEAWIEVNKLRNNLEHLVTHSIIKRISQKQPIEIEQKNLEYSIKYLIGVIIYLMNNLNNLML